jgi:hypothetical protein
VSVTEHAENAVSQVLTLEKHEHDEDRDDAGGGEMREEGGG